MSWSSPGPDEVPEPFAVEDADGYVRRKLGLFAVLGEIAGAAKTASGGGVSSGS